MDEEYDDLDDPVIELKEEQEISIINDWALKKARVTGSHFPLLLDPKKVLSFVDLWMTDPNTPISDLGLSPVTIICWRTSFLEKNT